MNQQSDPLVSVVIITYNSARYLIDTLESVKSQSWPTLELIVSDDCSSDNTCQLCHEWLKKNGHHFVKTRIITSMSNTGISSNCNRGLRLAAGMWIKTISGDDILLPDCIADNMDYATCSNATFIVSDITLIDEQGLPLAMENENEGLHYFVSKPTAEAQLKSYSRWPAFLNSPTFFFSREILDHSQLCDEAFRIYEDMAVIYRITGMGIRIDYLNKPTVAYRVHGKSASRNAVYEDIRKREAVGIFKKYRMKNLNVFNPVDLSIFYETWLRYLFKGLNGRKGESLLKKLSLFYWYLRLQGIKSY